MKKLILLFTLFPALLFAQEFKTGLIAGFITSQINGDNFGGYNRAGYTFGGLVNNQIDEKWSIQFEIDYIRKGSHKPQNPKAGDFSTTTIATDYVEVPIIAQYDFKKVKLEGGIYIARLVDAAARVDGVDFPINPPYHNMDYGIILGVNYFTNDHLSFNVRTENSIIPFDENASYAWKQLARRGMYHIVLNFSVRYHLNGSK